MVESYIGLVASFTVPTVPGHIIGLSITVDGAVGARGGTTSFEMAAVPATALK